MNRALLLLCIFITWYIPLKSQEKTISSSDRSAILYEIHGNGLSGPSYLFGTIHAVPRDRFYIPEMVTQKLIESETLVLEVDIDIPVKKQLEIAQRMFLTSDKTLKDYMTESEYNLLYAFLTDSLKINKNKADRYMHVKPFYLTGILLQEHYGKLDSYEKHLNKLAKKHDKSFESLETIEFQMNLIDTISVDLQLESYEITDVIDEYNKMLDIYYESDIDKLYNYIVQSNGFKEIEEAIYTIRNKNWIFKLKDLMAESTLFIAVGAGHLPGEMGLISLLEKQGYQIKALHSSYYESGIK